jgi:hypothetical protein
MTTGIKNMTASIISIKGFSRDDVDGRYWNADGTLGLVRDEDGQITLLNSDGEGTRSSLDDSHAAYILGQSAIDKDDAEQTIRRWEYYASAI